MKFYNKYGLPMRSGVDQSLGTSLFGDGSDGSATFNGSPVAGADLAGTVYTLKRNVYYTTAQVISGYTVLTNGFAIFCTTSFTVNNGAVVDASANGTTPVPPGSCMGSGKGGNAGSAASNMPNCFYKLNSTLNGGGGGAGGTGSSSGNTGGIGGAAISRNSTPVIPAASFRDIVCSLGGTDTNPSSLAGIGLFSGAPGGGGGGLGGGVAGGTGGTGGAGGGIVAIFSPSITINGTGVISAKGGTGGVGLNASGTNSGGGGGGGGGAGGLIYLVFSSGPEYTKCSVDGGAGGAGGTGLGSGLSGVSGATGGTGTLLWFNTSQNTWV